ncbi:MAG: KpsF/GutQ family sugar-phosphate isomerase [Verrucomicrobiota bacterium]
MDYLEKARRVLELEICELQRLEARLDQSFVASVDLIRACVERQGKVVVCGVGKSGAIGEKIAATLTSTGCPAVVLHPVNALHGDLGVIAEGDVLLGLSYSGETDELLGVLPAVARIGVKVIAMTGNPRSTLAQASAVVLDTNVEREACPLELAPTSSTTVMLALGDALAMVLLEVRGFTREDFARYHPAGRLGRTLLLRVRDIMRDTTQMALVNPAMTVREVLHAMTVHKAGAAVAVSEEGTMLGIFTHGDFARHFQSNSHIGEAPVGQYLTVKPVCVQEECLAAEVLLVLEKHRVDELVVLNQQGIPVGVVDSQDLARWRLA